MSLESRITAVVQAIGADIKALYATVGPGGLVETGAVMTYTNGLLTRVDYDSGNYKTFIYTSGVLTQFDYVVGGITTRKTFNYGSGGELISIDQNSF